MLRHYLLILIFSLSIFNSFAQKHATISGSITDRTNPINGCTVTLLNTNFVTSSNSDGSFSLREIPRGSYTLSVKALGYATVIQQVIVSAESTSVNISLYKSTQQLDEIVVTAQKQEDDILQLPFSVSALNSKQIENGKLWNLKDLTALSPNLYSANPGDNRNVTSIRGITTTSYDPAVTTYIDGVNQFSLDTYIAQLQDIERIEILRGPQGTLYGRNAMGGVINIITKQPENETRGFAELDFGNYDQQRYNLGIRTPIIKDKLYLGVSGMFSSFDGFYRNLFNNSKFDKQNTFLGNYYLKFQASPKLSFMANVKNASNHNNGPFTLASAKNTALENPFTVDQNSITKMADNQFNSSLSISYSGSDLNFVAQSTYQSDNRLYKSAIDGDFSPIDGVSIINDYGKDWNKVKVLTQEIRFSNPASSESKLKWLTGLYGFYQDNPVKQGTHFGADAEMVGVPYPFTTSININKSKRYGIAFFGQTTYNVTPELNFTAGLRYDYERNKQHVEGQFQPDGSEPIVMRPDTAASANFNAFSPKFSFQYRFANTSNIYATYSKGFRAGGLTQLSSDPGQPPLYPFEPETSNNYELGTKNVFFNKLSLNISLFLTSVNNAQVPTLILPDAITVTKNAGKLESKGIEIETAIKPVKGLDINYSLGYTDSKYKNLDVGSNGSSVDLSGNRQLFTPDITSFLTAQYTYVTISKYHFSARAEWKYLGKQYFDLANSLDQPAYSTFNTRLSGSFENYTLAVWGSNMFDKTYIDYAYDFGATHLGAPKTYGLTLSMTF